MPVQTEEGEGYLPAIRLGGLPAGQKDVVHEKPQAGDGGQEHAQQDIDEKGEAKLVHNRRMTPEGGVCSLPSLKGLKKFSSAAEAARMGG